MDASKFSDRGYKALFSYPEMVEALLRSHVRPDFLDAVDFSTLRRTAQSFVTEQFRERETDIVWEVRIRDQVSYLYLLIEFQSTVERFMALRVLTYVLLFYADVLKTQKDLQRLPPVFPIVLYSGDQRWTAPQAIEDLIHTPFASIRNYQPRFEYFKIAVNETLTVSPGDLVSGLFLLENTDVEQLHDAVARVLPLLSHQPDVRLRREFSLWLGRFLERAGLPSGIDISNMKEVEVHQMLEANIERWKQKVRNEAKVEADRTLEEVRTQAERRLDEERTQAEKRMQEIRYEERTQAEKRLDEERTQAEKRLDEERTQAEKRLDEERTQAEKRLQEVAARMLASGLDKADVDRILQLPPEALG